MTTGDIIAGVSAIIAGVALFRPEIETAIRRRRASIDMYPAARIEIGFSNFGPTVGIEGTLRAVGGDQFVSSAKVTVERQSDHMRHEFEWAVFRPASTSAISPTQTYEVASAFSLLQSAPRRFSIQFHDRVTAEKLQRPLNALQRLWQTYLTTNQISTAALTPQQLRGVYDQFHAVNIATITPLYTKMAQEFYWTEDRYRLTVTVTAERPIRHFSYQYEFHLTNEETELVHLNIVSSMAVVCGVIDAAFNFAFPKYL